MLIRGPSKAPVETLLQPVDPVFFGHWIQNRADDVVLLANTCLTRLIKHPPSIPLKFAYTNSNSYVCKSDFIILPPEFDQTTKFRVDVVRTLANFHKEFIEPTGRTWAFCSGDQQTYAHLIAIKSQFPEKYKWVIPIVGEWHWTWHVLKGIFIVWGKYLILPLSQHLGLNKVDLEANNFHYAESILQTITIACLKYMRFLMRIYNEKVPISLMHRLKPNSRVYELLYATIYYFGPYFIMRSALKFAKTEIIMQMWRYWLPLFVLTNKYNYAILTLRFTYMLHSFSEELADVFYQIRAFSFTGDAGSGIPIDGFNELVRILYIIVHHTNLHLFAHLTRS